VQLSAFLCFNGGSYDDRSEKSVRASYLQRGEAILESKSSILMGSSGIWTSFLPPSKTAMESQFHPVES